VIVNSAESRSVEGKRMVEGELRVRRAKYMEMYRLNTVEYNSDGVQERASRLHERQGVADVHPTFPWWCAHRPPLSA
jgi:hypothetical protein